jgi:hypothetical protein
LLVRGGNRALMPVSGSYDALKAIAPLVGVDESPFLLRL